MLRFASPPDPVFLDILHAAIEDCLRWLETTDYGQEEFSNSYHHSAKCFHPKLAEQTLEELLQASKSPSLFQVTDYHWLLLYEVLWEFCKLFNDEPQEVAPFLEKKYGIREIEFYSLVDFFFWDIDFFTSQEDILNMGESGLQQMDFSKEAWGVIQRMVPHPEELKMIELSPQEAAECKDSRTEEGFSLFQPGASKYPSDVHEDE